MFFLNPILDFFSLMRRRKRALKYAYIKFDFLQASNFPFWSNLIWVSWSVWKSLDQQQHQQQQLPLQVHYSLRKPPSWAGLTKCLLMLSYSVGCCFFGIKTVEGCVGAKKFLVFLGLRQLLIWKWVVLLAVFSAETIGFACWIGWFACWSGKNPS